MAEADVRNDEPIDSIVNDLFGFSFQASVIAKLVGGKDSKDHLSVGVSGSWGSGKTSLLNMVRELLEYNKNEDNFNKLKKSLGRNKIKNVSILRKMIPFYRLKKEVQKKDYLKEVTKKLQDIKVIWFDPWFFGSQETVIKAFFYRLAKELMDEDRELAKLFLKLAVVMSSSPNLPDSLPVVGNAFKVINYSRNLLSWMSGDDGSVQDFSDLKRKICERLKNREFTYYDDEDEKKNKIRKRIVVIIDDLDRLQTDEALTMLKVIRLVTELGVNFVIGYDEETLSGTIDHECGGFGREYIRKMINVPTYMPIPTKDKLSEYQQKQLSIIQSKHPITLDPKSDFYEFWRINVDLVKTIRQAKRVINTFNLIFPVFNNIMDGNILLGLILLYNYFPELFFCLINIKTPFHEDDGLITFIKVNNNEQLTKDNNTELEKIMKNDIHRINMAKRLCAQLLDLGKQRMLVAIKDTDYEAATLYKSWSVYFSLIPRD